MISPVTSNERANNYVPLSYCVRIIQMDLEDYAGTNYEKLLQYAIMGFQKMNFNDIHSIEVKYLPISDINTVELPSDFDDYYKIGLLRNGEVWNLGLNNNIAMPRAIECGEDAREITTGRGNRGGYFYTDHYLDGQFVDGLFGIGGGFRESCYRIDKKQGQILLDSTVPNGEIVLEYQSNGISSQTMVPRRAVDAIVAYVHWRRLKAKNRDNERYAAEVEWKEEINEFRALNMAFKPSEYLDMLHSNMIQAPKR